MLRDNVGLWLTGLLRQISMKLCQNTKLVTQKINLKAFSAKVRPFLFCPQCVMLLKKLYTYWRTSKSNLLCNLLWIKPTLTNVTCFLFFEQPEVHGAGHTVPGLRPIDFASEPIHTEQRFHHLIGLNVHLHGEVCVSFSFQILQPLF